MNGFRRWTIGVCAKFDELLGQVENHEALAAQALRDMKTSLARAHGQLARVNRDLQRLEAEAHKARESATLWRTRAARESDDERALECLRRSRADAEQAQKTGERVREQSEMRDQVERTVRELEQKFLDLSGKQRLLSTREAAAAASQAVQDESGTSAAVEDVFCRWETRLTEREFVPGVGPVRSDRFADCYDEEEERDSLARELATLRATESDLRASESDAQPPAPDPSADRSAPSTEEDMA